MTYKTPTKTPVTILQFFPITPAEPPSPANRQPEEKTGKTAETESSEPPVASYVLLKENNSASQPGNEKYTKGS